MCYRGAAATTSSDPQADIPIESLGLCIFLSKYSTMGHCLWSVMSRERGGHIIRCPSTPCGYHDLDFHSLFSVAELFTQRNEPKSKPRFDEPSHRPNKQRELDGFCLCVIPTLMDHTDALVQMQTDCYVTATTSVFGFLLQSFVIFF